MGVSSGIKVSECAKAAIQKVSSKSASSVACCLIINDTKDQIIYEENSEIPKSVDQPFEKLMEQLPKDKCRYAGITLNFALEGRDTSKDVLIMWSPDGATTKDKMQYTTSWSKVKDEIKLNHNMEFHDADDQTIDPILRKLGDKDTVTSFQGKPVKISECSNAYEYV
uniref:Cofilin n=1 Tax=Ciona intestinalis TaxID=7719 RepID=H2XUR3_CIOIN|nr:cofilin [Ciona intestinalis]|eukprot:XP_002131354.1 cofilin [Ciona intestinalis]